VTSIRKIIRRLGRNRINVAISLLILGLAAFTLYQVLRDIDVGKVVAALEAQSGRQILTAGALVVAGYIALAFYDVFALRTIDRRNVPFQVAAFASFTSYTIGHTLGVATLTGSVVRHRIYSVWGLNAIDIAKIAFVTGMTFCLGATFVLGGAMSYAPAAAGAVDGLPLWLNRLIGLSALSSIACYLIWIMPKRRVVGRANWRIVLPNLRFTLVQIAIGTADLSLITLAMYALLSANPIVGFPTVLVIFLTATLLGAISHAPGGLGVIEAAMLIGLPQFPREELLATLLTFRVLYFVIPLVFAALVMSLRELRLVARPPPPLPRS
jgi:glycosyltransferase 2 family protein